MSQKYFYIVTKNKIESDGVLNIVINDDVIVATYSLEEVEDKVNETIILLKKNNICTDHCFSTLLEIEKTQNQKLKFYKNNIEYGEFEGLDVYSRYYFNETSKTFNLSEQYGKIRTMLLIFRGFDDEICRCHIISVFRKSL